MHSASYWVERFALIIILGLGESVVALGVGAVQVDVSPALVGAIALTVLLAFSLWWAYFERMEPASEHLLAETHGTERTSIATDAYTYLHFPILVGHHHHRPGHRGGDQPPGRARARDRALRRDRAVRRHVAVLRRNRVLLAPARGLVAVDPARVRA